MGDEAAVLHGGDTVGRLTRSGDGKVSLSYADGYLADPGAVPMSVTAPLTAGSHDATSWVDGLFPDDERVRTRWAADFGARSEAPFDLLSTRLGLDCPGAFRFCPPRHAERILAEPGRLTRLSDSQVGEIIGHLRRDTTSWIKPAPGERPAGGFGFALAGAQGKTALRRDGRGWARPHGLEPTTHILKPAIRDDLPDVDLIEHLTQQTARNLGLDAAETECLTIGGERVLSVTRYDRARGRDGAVGCVHQEDMCQAVGAPPKKKYQNEGGPTPGQIADMLRRCSPRPGRDIEAFRDFLLFAWMAASTDGHAKNYGIVLEPSGGVRLAPLYDACTVLPFGFGPVSKYKLAMKMGRDYTLRKADRQSALTRLSASLGLPAGDTLGRSADLAKRLPDAAAKAVDELPDAAWRADKTVQVFARRLHARAVHCRSLPRSGAGTHQHADGTSHHTGATYTRAARTEAAAAPPARVCGHLGVRTRRRCVLRPGHNGPHRYTPPA